MSDETPHRFVLVRHAEAVCNVLTPDARIERYDMDAALTKRGEAQAAALASGLPDELVGDPIFCSPLRRARETAMPLAQQRRLAVVYDDRLAEMGATECFVPPLSMAEWDMLLERRAANPEAEVSPGIEPLSRQDARVRDFLRDRHAHRGDARCTLLVAHAFTIELAILALLGLQSAALTAFRLRLSNAAVHVVENNALGGLARLLLVNAKNHMTRWL